MDLDDSFTEKLIQRNKARKEFINETKMEIPLLGKKRSALVDEQQIYSSSPSKPPKESPKRQCVQSVHFSHDKENFQMKDEDSGLNFVPFHSASKSKGLAALKKNFEDNTEDSKPKATPEQQGNIEVGSGANKQGRLPVWDEAIKATLNSPTITKYPAKSGFDSTEDRIEETHPSDECNSLDNESIDENDFAENYQDINSEIESAKMELDCSPIKPLKKQENMHKKPAMAEMIATSLSKEPVNNAVDPAELPLSARKALFEKALLGGTPKLNEDVIDHKLSVAQRAAMFENASKTQFETKYTNFKEPKRIALSNFSKFDKTVSNKVIKSPVKTVQYPPKAEPEITDSPVVQRVIVAPVVSPVKTTVTSPMKKITDTVASTLSPSKHVGNHTRLIQQKLIENSATKWQEKDVVAKASEERKKEISNLVNHWEKLSSSSSVENNSEVERDNLASEEQNLSGSEAAEEPSEYDDESDSAYVNEDYENENEDADEDVDENEDADENDIECSDEESDIVENVFDVQDTETGNRKYIQPNYVDEQNSWQTEDAQSSSSHNTRSIISSPSLSGISSYSDDSNYNASKSRSCTSDSSARSYDVSNSNASEGAPVISKESKNPEVPLLYTVSFYRKQKQETRLTPVRTIVRREKVSSPESPDTDYTEIIQERIKALHEEVLRQQTVISQTSQALNLCSATTEFSGSSEQVEGEKLLLIATQKRQALLNEITRLKTYGAQGENIADGTGTLIITDIHLPLKREFIASQLEGKGADTVHYFLCLIRHGPQVIVTQMMSTIDKVTDGALYFTNHIKLQNLPADFSVVFEVYALQAKKEVLPHEKKYHIKREHSRIRLTPKGKKADGKILLPAVSSPGGPNAVRSPSFGVVGFTRFTLQNCNKKTFTLDKVPFTSPLEGVLRVKLQLHAEHKVMEKGFLTMFEDVSGFGAWHRRWCALDAHSLAYWKYPDDEHKKEPIGSIDLKQCVTGEVKLVSRDICARPHTFQLVTVRPQEKGDKNTLISRSVNTLTTTKHLLSADTKEERILWCNKLNDALTNVRKWDPQALRPIETMQI